MERLIPLALFSVALIALLLSPHGDSEVEHEEFSTRIMDRMAQKERSARMHHTTNKAKVQDFIPSPMTSLVGGRPNTDGMPLETELDQEDDTEESMRSSKHTDYQEDDQDEREAEESRRYTRKEAEREDTHEDTEMSQDDDDDDSSIPDEAEPVDPPKVSQSARTFQPRLFSTPVKHHVKTFEPLQHHENRGATTHHSSRRNHQKSVPHKRSQAKATKASPSRPHHSATKLKATPKKVVLSPRAKAAAMARLLPHAKKEHQPPKDALKKFEKKKKETPKKKAQTPKKAAPTQPKKPKMSDKERRMRALIADAKFDNEDDDDESSQSDRQRLARLSVSHRSSDRRKAQHSHRNGAPEQRGNTPEPRRLVHKGDGNQVLDMFDDEANDERTQDEKHQVDREVRKAVVSEQEIERQARAAEKEKEREKVTGLVQSLPNYHHSKDDGLSHTIGEKIKHIKTNVFEKKHQKAPAPRAEHPAPRKAHVERKAHHSHAKHEKKERPIHHEKQASFKATLQHLKHGAGFAAKNQRAQELFAPDTAPKDVAPRFADGSRADDMWRGAFDVPKPDEEKENSRLAEAADKKKIFDALEAEVESDNLEDSDSASGLYEESGTPSEYTGHNF